MSYENYCLEAFDILYSCIFGKKDTIIVSPIYDVIKEDDNNVINDDNNINPIKPNTYAFNLLKNSPEMFYDILNKNIGLINFDTIDEDGNTLLIYATLNYDKNKHYNDIIIKILEIDNININFNISNNKKERFIDCLMKLNNTNIIKSLLMDHRIDFNGLIWDDKQFDKALICKIKARVLIDNTIKSLQEKKCKNITHDIIYNTIEKTEYPILKNIDIKALSNYIEIYLTILPAILEHRLIK